MVCGNQPEDRKSIVLFPQQPRQEWSLSMPLLWCEGSQHLLPQLVPSHIVQTSWHCTKGVLASSPRSTHCESSRADPGSARDRFCALRSSVTSASSVIIRDAKGLTSWEAAILIQIAQPQHVGTGLLCLQHDGLAAAMLPANLLFLLQVLSPSVSAQLSHATHDQVQWKPWASHAPFMSVLEPSGQYLELPTS